MYNIVTAVFDGKKTTVTDAINYQYDIAQVLVIEGIELPVVYEVDFCCKGDSSTITIFGDSNGVQIPDELLYRGETIKAYIVVVDGDSTQTRYDVTIPVKKRPERTDYEPAPAQQLQIDTLLDAMNEAVQDAEMSAQTAEAFVDELPNITASSETLEPGAPAAVTYEEGNFHFGLPRGERGPQGPAGVPSGGTTGQVLTKQSNEDGDADWEDAENGLPSGGTTGQVLTKQSDADNDADWEDAPSGGGTFIVNITGTGWSSRTSDKTPTEIKAAFDAGMSIIANIVNEGCKAYLWSISSSRAVFHTLPKHGLSNDHYSLMFYSFEMTSANSTYVYCGYESVTSAEELFSKVNPHEFVIEWNDHGFMPTILIAHSEGEWVDFYDGISGSNTAYLASVYYVDNKKYIDVFSSNKMWLTREYDADYGDDVYVGHIIFINTQLDGNNLKTTEIKLRHVLWSDTLTMDYRTVAVNAVTTTTDYPVPYWPE